MVLKLSLDFYLAIGVKRKKPFFKGFLRGFIDSFRNLCFDPPVEMRLIFSELEKLRELLEAA